MKEFEIFKSNIIEATAIQQLIKELTNKENILQQIKDNIKAEEELFRKEESKLDFEKIKKNIAAVTYYIYTLQVFEDKKDLENKQSKFFKQHSEEKEVKLPII